MAQPEAWILWRKIIGASLRQARQEGGKTLQECAQVVGLSSGKLSAIERGKGSISLPEIELLAYYLDVPVESLLEEEREAQQEAAEDLPVEELMALRHRIIGALLRQARLEANLTQAELAKRAGVSKSRLSKYELGEQPIPIVELLALAEVLDISWTRFLDEGVGPVGEQQQLKKAWRQFLRLPPEVRAFVADPANVGYLQLAMSLSDVPADGLRNIAASLLDITL